MQSKKTIQTVSDTYTYITFGEPKRCIHRFDSHTLICVYSGELEIISEGKQTRLKPGNCAFIAAKQMAQGYGVSFFRQCIPCRDAVVATLFCI